MRLWTSCDLCLTVRWNLSSKLAAENMVYIYNNMYFLNARAITRQLLCDNFRPEAASDVISGVAVEPTGVKVRVKFGDSRQNRSRDIRLPHFVTNYDADNDAGRRTL